MSINASSAVAETTYTWSGSPDGNVLVRLIDPTLAPLGASFDTSQGRVYFFGVNVAGKVYSLAPTDQLNPASPLYASVG